MIAILGVGTGTYLGVEAVTPNRAWLDPLAVGLIELFLMQNNMGIKLNFKNSEIRNGTYLGVFAELSGKILK